MDTMFSGSRRPVPLIVVEGKRCTCGEQFFAATKANCSATKTICAISCAFRPPPLGRKVGGLVCKV